MSSSPSSAAESGPTKASFRLKGGLFPLTLLELQHYDLDSLRHDLQLKVAEAPGFFQQTPVIVSVETLEGEQNEINLQSLRDALAEHGMIAVAIKGAHEALAEQAARSGLAVMTANARSHRQSANPEPVAAIDPAPEVKIETPPAPQAVAPNNKIITTPVRSGQQVYAPGGDLIVLAPVSAGAEILADGNIHVYAPLRGRALAGVQGDESAQVFCQSLEAELISIAGHFKLVEDLKNEHWKQSVRISLQAQALCIHALNNSGR